MNMPIDLYFLRHGESELNVANRMSREGDSSIFTKDFCEAHTANIRLSEIGRQQAKLAGDWLKKESLEFDAHITSPYVRTMETAGLLGLKNVLWEKSVHFSERDWGTIEQTSRAGMAGPEKENWDTKDQHPIFWRPTGGERFVELCNRIDFALKQISQKRNPKRVLIVSHGDLMGGVRLLLEKISFEDFERQEVVLEESRKIFNCQILHYTRQTPKMGTLAGPLNDTFSFVREIRPTENPVWVSDWRRINETTYDSQELLMEVIEHRHFLSKS